MNPPIGDRDHNATDDSDFSFREYRKLFLAQLDDLQRGVRDTQKSISELRENELSSMRTEIALLKLKNSLWSVLISSVASALITIMTLLATKVGH